VYVCDSMSFSVTPSEMRSSSSSVRPRAALLGALLCVNDAFPMRAYREGPAVLVVAVAVCLSFLARVENRAPPSPTLRLIVVFSGDATRAVPENAPSATWVREAVIVADACRINPELMACNFVAEAG